MAIMRGETPDTRRGGRAAAGASEPHPDAWLWECGSDGRISFLSPDFAGATGLAPEALLGKDLSALAAAAVRAAPAGGMPFSNLLVKTTGGDGAAVWLELAGRPIAAAEDRFAGYRGVGRAVTAEITAALALRHSERRYRELFEVASDWFWEIDADSRFTFVSPNVEAIVGQPVSFYIGKRLADTEGIIMDRDAGRASAAAIRARRSYRDFVYSRRLPGGRSLWVSSSGAPYYDEHGRFLGYRGIARDVTAQIEAAQVLRDAKDTAEAANRAKSEFLAKMSHELRTPLNAVIGYSELLLENAAAAGREDQDVVDLRRINAAGRHLLALVADILDLAKIEADKVELIVQPFALDALVDDVVATCRPLVVENGNAFVVERAGSLGTVVGDATRLRQVMLNLLSNAGKFTRSGRISLEVAREMSAAGERIAIAVRDTGIGISAVHMPRLFQNFSQADASIARRYGGTGLGLAISRKLCRLMGGDIWVESTPGRGSCFTIRLPAVLAPAPGIEP